MGVVQEFKRQWAFWTVIFFAGGMKTLVNQVEQPFARSLVVCDTPIEAGAPFSGSAHCGDRLRVIGEGFSISSVGQAQENFAMLCSLTLVAILAGAFGRKLALLLGLVGTTVSVVLFTIASTSVTTGRLLFATGQGLQGLFPIDYLVGLILLDLSNQPGADGVATFQLATYNGTIGALLWGVGFGNLVQLLELSDYRLVWTIILVINCSVLCIAAFLMPETAAPKEAAKGADGADGPLMKVVHEVLSYRATLGDWKARRFLSMRFCESFWNHVPFGVVPVQLMAYHGWTQTQIVIVLFLLQPFGLCCLPIVGGFCAKFGTRRTWIACLWVIYISLFTCALTVAVSGTMPMLCIYVLAFLSGFMPLKGYVDSKFSTPEQMSRFTSVQWIMGYFLGMMVGPFYASVLDVKAEAYFPRSVPNLLSMFPMFCQILLIWKGMYRIDGGKDGFKVTLDLIDEANFLVPEVFRLATKSQAAPLAEEAWKGAGLEAAFSKTLQEAGGPFESVDQFKQFITNQATTNEAGVAAMDALKQALPVAKKWSGMEQEDGSPAKEPPEDKKTQ